MEETETIRVDTRITPSHVIGHDMLNRAGFDPADYEGRSNKEIAKDVADFHRLMGTVWIDYDGLSLSVESYVGNYLGIGGH